MFNHCIKTVKKICLFFLNDKQGVGMVNSNKSANLPFLEFEILKKNEYVKWKYIHSKNL